MASIEEITQMVEKSLKQDFVYGDTWHNKEIRYITLWAII